MTYIKICGNTNTEDVRSAIDCGADYLGFIFAESKRKVSIATVQKIFKAIPEARSRSVGVFLNQSLQEVEKIAKALELPYLQFHGTETPEECQSFQKKGYAVIKTIHVKDAESLKAAGSYEIFAFLLDSATSGNQGGTGKPFDWHQISQHPELPQKFFLAGGLTPENVEEALSLFHPFAVDVVSGIEIAPGKKDLTRLEKFIATVKRGTNHASK